MSAITMKHFLFAVIINFFYFQGHSEIHRVPSHVSMTGSCLTDEQFRQARENLSSKVADILMTPCGGMGWKRIANLNMSDSSQNCPTGLRLTTTPFRLCGRTPTVHADCNSATFSVGGTSYSRVCGRITGYHQNLKYAFYRLGDNLEQNYIDGVSLTHGAPGSRQHIWSFAIGLNNVDTGNRLQYYCPGDGRVVLPSFVTNDYFCDSGAYPGSSQSSNGVYIDNPLWDGVGCVGDVNTPPRCFINNPPWFHKVLPEATSDDIELRVCGYELIGNLYGDTFLQEVELYVF